MGKTAQGAIWLNADQCNPYEFWQYWRNTEDADVARFLKLFTTLRLSEIEKLGALQGAEINEAKRILATEATKLLHGPDAAIQAERSAKMAFEQGRFGSELPKLTITIGSSLATANTQIGFSTSNAEARKLIQSGAVYLGDRRIVDPHYRISWSDFGPDGHVLLSTGKKRKGILTPGSE
jgi:tyrosyl-tRNA synthetase